MQTVAFFLFEGVELLDFSGPQSVFFTAEQCQPNSYRTLSFSHDGAVVTSETGTRVLPDCALSALQEVDILVLPGGVGSRNCPLPAEVLRQLAELVRRTPLVVTICTGVFWLGRLGLLQQQRVATHWDFCHTLQQQYPSLSVDSDALFVCEQGWSQNQQLWTSAGVTAGIDLALHLVALRFGALRAAEVARYLVVYVRRDGGQRQFSQPMRQEVAEQAWAELSHWLANHLAQPLTIARIAEQVNLSERQFFRVCQQRFGLTPGQWLEQMRMEQARLQLQALPAKHISLKKLAGQLGYQHYPSFTRAFIRQYGVSPQRYQQHFCQSAE